MSYLRTPPALRRGIASLRSQYLLKSLVPAMTACMAFGIFDILYKIASARDVNPLTFLIVQSATAQILINLYVALHEKHPLNRIVLQIAPLCGILFTSASLSMLKALEEVDVSLLSPFIQMSLVVSYRKVLGITIVALSVLLLSEDLFRRLSNLWAG